MKEFLRKQQSWRKRTIIPEELKHYLIERAKDDSRFLEILKEELKLKEKEIFAEIFKKTNNFRVAQQTAQILLQYKYPVQKLFN